MLGLKVGFPTPLAYMMHKDGPTPGRHRNRFIDDLTEHDCTAARIAPPKGIVFAMAIVTVEADGRRIRLRDVHTHLEEGHANALVIAWLRRIARAFMEQFDYDELVIEGARRTSGANPGHRPGIQRFTRRVGPAPET
jgi:hypothetical protein